MARTGRATNDDRIEPTIPNHKITNEADFQEVTKNPRQIAGAYFYLQLDCLVAYAHQVAVDFFRRPQLYTDLKKSAGAASTGRARPRSAPATAPGTPTSAPADAQAAPTIAPDLARLRAQYGNDERVPNQEQRDEIFLPLFGQSSALPANGQGDFPRLRDELLGAAAAFAERVYDTGEEMLRERVRTAHRPFRDYLTGLQGDSLVWSTDEALTGVARKLAYPILRNKGVAAVFGISTPPREQWPFAEDANADKLVEQISKQVLGPTNLHPAITREGISNRQRVALRGAEALATILDFSEEDTNERDLDLLITKCYTWGSALQSLTQQPAGQPAYTS